MCLDLRNIAFVAVCHPLSLPWKLATCEGVTF